MARKTRRQILLEEHVARLRQCRRCPRMIPPPVSGGPVVSKILLIGQAPGVREPVLRRPFAHTAGRTLFQWLEKFCGLDEATVRARIYFAAVCRCFPGKSRAGTDRVPAPDEIQNCSSWLDHEFAILRPELVIPVGKLAIEQFIPCPKLEGIIGRKFSASRAGNSFDLIPLPHPSGASPWPKISPGRELTARALRKIARHPAMRRLAPKRVAAAKTAALE
jgi:uracil-DNA glycosylase